MRQIHVSTITDVVEKLCIEANNRIICIVKVFAYICLQFLGLAFVNDRRRIIPGNEALTQWYKRG